MEYMTLEAAIAKRIVELCNENYITYNKLATLAGVTQSTINSIIKGESKNPKLGTLKKISEGLNITLSELLNTDYINDSLVD